MSHARSCSSRVIRELNHSPNVGKIHENSSPVIVNAQRLGTFCVQGNVLGGRGGRTQILKGGGEGEGGKGYACVMHDLLAAYRLYTCPVGRRGYRRGGGKGGERCAYGGAS